MKFLSELARRILAAAFRDPQPPKPVPTTPARRLSRAKKRRLRRKRAKQGTAAANGRPKCPDQV